MHPQQTANMDETDKKILQLLQDDFPLVEQPYKALGEKLNLTETQTINRLKHLTQQGKIQKIGAIVNKTKNGKLAATLVALRVPSERVTAVAQVINQYSGVSHNYLREHEYNVWFTLNGQTHQELQTTLNEILQRAAVATKDMLNLPTKNCFKIKVHFQIA